MIFHESGAEKAGHNNNFCAALCSSHAGSHRAVQGAEGLCWNSVAGTKPGAKARTFILMQMHKALPQLWGFCTIPRGNVPWWDPGSLSGPCLCSCPCVHSQHQTWNKETLCSENFYQKTILCRAALPVVSPGRYKTSLWVNLMVSVESWLLPVSPRQWPVPRNCPGGTPACALWCQQENWVVNGQLVLKVWLTPACSVNRQVWFDGLFDLICPIPALHLWLPWAPEQPWAHGLWAQAEPEPIPSLPQGVSAAPAPPSHAQGLLNKWIFISIHFWLQNNQISVFFSKYRAEKHT